MSAGDFAVDNLVVTTINGESPGGGSSPPPVNAQTVVDYVLALTDAPAGSLNMGIVTMNNSAASKVEIPRHSSVAWATPTTIRVIQLGLGKVQFSPQSGATIQTASSLFARVQNSEVTLTYLGSDLWIIGGDTVGGGGGPGDSFWPEVDLLMSFNGANGSTTVVDLSNQAVPMECRGTAVLSSTQTQFGATTSLQSFHDGAVGIVGGAIPTALQPNNSEWTIEFWMYANTYTNGHAIIALGSTAGNLPIYVQTNGSGTLTSFVQNTAGFQYSGVPTDVPVPVSEWHFIQIRRQVDTIQVGVDGVQQSAHSTISTQAELYTAADFVIGNDTGLALGFDGYLYDVRYTIGTARPFALPIAPLPTF